MPKFQVGDYVIGNEEANKHYGITRHGWIGVVSRASSRRNDFIAVSSVDYDEFGLYDEYGEPYGYCLDDECFDLYVPDKADEPTFEALDAMFDEFV